MYLCLKTKEFVRFKRYVPAKLLVNQQPGFESTVINYRAGEYFGIDILDD